MEGHGPARVKRWDALEASNREAAATEAWTRRILIDQRTQVKPGDEPPDFTCQSSKQLFAVECTNIGTEATTRKTGLSDLSDGPSSYRPLNDAVLGLVKGKAGKLRGINQPTVVVVGTLHFMAGVLSVDALHAEH